MLLVFMTGLVVLGWWMNTPPGVLGKADAAGYAVCHRIASRSFQIGDRPMPLCSRCSGMYLGALLGMLYLSRWGKRAGMPSLKVSIVLGFFLAAFALDGGNSYLHFFPQAPGLYQPQNWLRLLTGTGIGLGIASVLVPVIHQTLWKTYDGRAALAGWRQFLPLLGLAAVLDLALLSEIPLLLYPLAILSSLSIFLILTLVYALVWTLVSKKDNRYESIRELWVPVLAGFLTAVIQIAVLDAGRFWLTGTWAGFNL
jgi:uncharacterized membrane protein